MRCAILLVEKICPRCGAKSNEKKFIENFCIDCFRSYIDIDTPAAVEIPACRTCGRVKLKLGWQDKNDEEIGKFVLRQCSAKYEDAKARLTDDGACEITFTIKAGESTIEVIENVGIKYSATSCDKCSRESSGYFEAIIQLRGAEEKVKRTQAKMLPYLEKNSFISKVKDTHRGIDMYVGSKQVAAEIIGQLGFKPKVSNKLHGVKDGQRIYRTTFSIRL
ncbi:MAG: NMD3-related protein [Candidatus Micrarchaeia archaeon]|jgi:nonsense-mediated mRNA decay protein 3